jgi:hypothetical protein
MDKKALILARDHVLYSYMEPLKVLYVGGLYQAEMSLYWELMDNPQFEGCFCTHPKEPGFYNNVHKVTSRQQINEIISSFKPDLTIFRSWNATTAWAQGKEIVWAYEKRVKLPDGGQTAGPRRYRDGSNSLNAYQDLDSVKEHNALWLPYCVSKYFEKKSQEKKHKALCISRIPTAASGGAAKKLSADILLKPLLEHNLIVLYGRDYFGISYLKFQGMLSPHNIIEEVASARIFVSPTTIWLDPYALSHKTVSSMGCGTLTMTNKYGAIEEILGKHKETILYSNEPEETLELVQYYLDHDTEREELAMAGYNWVHEKYNWGDHLLRLHDESTNL